MERRLCTVHHRHMGPERLAALPTAIPHVEGHDLARLGIHGEPHPWRVGFLLHEAPAIPAHRLVTSSSHVNNMICEGVDHPFCLDACRMGTKRGTMAG